MMDAEGERIKIIALGNPRAGMDLQAFQDHWRHPHGTWALGVATMDDYVQAFRLHTDLLGPDQSRYSGAAEEWFLGPEAVVAHRSDPVLLRYMVEDDARFGDSNVVYVAAREDYLSTEADYGGLRGYADDLWSWKRPNAVKIYQLYERETAADWATPDDRELGWRIGALRHVRCHAIALDHGWGGAPSPYIGVRELWWPTLTAFEAGVRAAPDAWHTLTRRKGQVSMLMKAERIR